MASIGLKSFKYNKIDNATSKYATLKGSAIPVLKGAIDCSVTLNNAEAKLYGDDTMLEQVSQFTNGSIKMTTAYDDDTVFADVLGHTINEEGEVLRKTTDTAPYIGIGHIVTIIESGVKKYRVEFLPKVKFAPSIPDGKTAGESIEFSSVSIEGVVFALDKEINGIAKDVYEIHKTFATEQEANTYLDTLLTPSA